MKNMIKKLKFILLLFFSTGSLAYHITSNFQDSNEESYGYKMNNYITPCYFTDWSNYRPGKGSFNPEDINIKDCTHIVYAFALMTLDVKKNIVEIVPADPNVDITKGFYEQVTALKKKGLGVLLSVGGWNDSTKKYSIMMNDYYLRTQFIEKIIAFLIKYGFTGLDCDIEFPGYYQLKELGSPNDKENFVLLLQELRAAFDAKIIELNSDERLLLSVAVSANEKVINISYDVPAIACICDWIGVMTYDFHTAADKETGLNAPFTAQPGDTDLNFNVVGAMNLWLTAGAPANKLVLGIPCYGQLFALDDPYETHIHAKATEGTYEGVYTQSNTTLSFYEIADNVMYEEWNVVHTDFLGTYAFKGSLWVGYDDKVDVAIKADYIKNNNFLGAMFWSLDNDCFQKDGSCRQIYPLISTVRDILDDKINLEDVTNYT